MEEKRKLHTAHHDEVVQVLHSPPGPGAEAVRSAAAELLDILGAHLIETFPDRYVPGSGGDAAALMDPRNGKPYVQPDNRCNLHPLELAGLLVPEDLCLHMVGPDGLLRLVAGSVAFPSAWSLHEKLGQPLADIHEPVPGYAATISYPVDRLMHTLKPERGLWRLNGSLLDDAALFRPHPDPTTVAPRVPDDIVIRVERQTLRRLPQTQAIIFTIRTYVHPLASIADDPDSCARVASCLRGIPPDQVDYKGLELRAPSMLAWLDERASRGSNA